MPGHYLDFEPDRFPAPPTYAGWPSGGMEHYRARQEQADLDAITAAEARAVADAITPPKQED